jgi:nucleoside-diphosphate-sugar epimerase
VSEILMRAVVTGGAGFLGRYLVEQLVARGDHVLSIGRHDSPALRDLGAETYRADVRDLEALNRILPGADCVFHTAALAGFWGPWRAYYETNTQGTHNVVQACWNHRLPKLVFTSSPSVTFDGTDQLGVDERAPYPSRYLCHYSHSKALAEQFVLAAHGRQGLATCALRPHLIWGPRDSHLIPTIIARAHSGQLRRIGSGDNLIDTVYVENAARAHLLAADALALESASGGRAYFISQGEPVNCWDWINEILGLAGLPPVTRSVSHRTAWWLGSVCELVHRILAMHEEPLMTRFLAAQLATSHYFDISAARRDLGYEPSISFSEGMSRLARELACK